MDSEKWRRWKKFEKRLAQIDPFALGMVRTENLKVARRSWPSFHFHAWWFWRLCTSAGFQFLSWVEKSSNRRQSHFIKSRLNCIRHSKWCCRHHTLNWLQIHPRKSLDMSLLVSRKSTHACIDSRFRQESILLKCHNLHTQQFLSFH